jgi:hypothetical protein
MDFAGLAGEELMGVFSLQLRSSRLPSGESISSARMQTPDAEQIQSARMVLRFIASILL